MSEVVSADAHPIQTKKDKKGAKIAGSGSDELDSTSVNLPFVTSRSCNIGSVPVCVTCFTTILHCKQSR